MLYIALHSWFEQTLLFTILSIISSSGVVRLYTLSTFLPFEANILSNSSACFTVLGNPSKIIPFSTSGSFNLSSIIFIVTSSGTKFPFEI